MKKKKRPVTAKEFARQLEGDPVYLERMRLHEQQVKEHQRRFKADSSSLMQELAAKGFEYEWLDDLRHSGIVYREAVPSLLKWLPRIPNVDVKESIVRALSVPWAKPQAASTLIQEFRSVSPSDAEYKWAIGNALDVVADESVLEEMLALVSDHRHGTSRQMMVLALGHLRGPGVIDVLLSLLNDDDVRGHAIAALGKQGVWSTIPFIEPFLKDQKSWIRQETKKAIERIKKRALKIPARGRSKPQ